MDRGNVNPIQHLPWWLRETTKRTLICLVRIGIWTLNSPNTSPLCWISIGAMLFAFKSFIIETLRSRQEGIRVCILNRCNDATVRTRELPLLHASCDVITLSRAHVASRNKWFTIMFFTRLTSWESACKIIARHGNISPLYPFPLSSSLSLSIFLSSLRNKSKTKVFPVHLKTILEVVLSELKIWNYHHYVQKIMRFLQKHSHSLKLKYLFRAHLIFMFTH